MWGRGGSVEGKVKAEGFLETHPTSKGSVPRA